MPGSWLNQYGKELIVVRREKGGLIDRWNQRGEDQIRKGQLASPFSDSQNRFCASHSKINPTDNEIRRPKPAAPPFSSSTHRFCSGELKGDPSDKQVVEDGSQLVICAMGNRSQESRQRAADPVYSVRNSVTTTSLKQPTGCGDARKQEQWADQALQSWVEEKNRKKPLLTKAGKPRKPEPFRLALNWYPIKHWSIDQVWEWCGASAEDLARRVKLYQAGRWEEALTGWTACWVYVTGISRLSCSLCVLARKADLEIGAAHNPQSWHAIREIERKFDYRFKNDLAITDLVDHVRAMSNARRNRLTRLLRSLDFIAPDEALQTLASAAINF